MNQLRVNNRAETDLANIWLYIAQDRLGAADKLLDKLKAAFEDIAAHPHVGEPRPRLGRRIRAYTVGAYVIYFQPVEAAVEIVRVIHGARNVTDLAIVD